MEKDRLIELLKSRTVANGCTEKEEIEARKKVFKLMEEKYKEETCPLSGYASHETFGSYANDIIEKNFDYVMKKYVHTHEPMKAKKNLKCPRCGSEDWYKGSRGSGAMNILCSNCFREYNYSMGNLFGNGDWKSVNLDTLGWYGIKYPNHVEEDNPVGFKEVWNSSSWWQKLKYKFKDTFNLW